MNLQFIINLTFDMQVFNDIVTKISFLIIVTSTFDKEIKPCFQKNPSIQTGSEKLSVLSVGLITESYMTDI